MNHVSKHLISTLQVLMLAATTQWGFRMGIPRTIFISFRMAAQSKWPPTMQATRPHATK
jgi:hypothetical protein